MSKETVQALQWTGDALRVLDQRQLPEHIVYDECKDAAEVAKAISSMRVRGAPAIGIAAAYGVVLSVRKHYAQSNHWRQKVVADIELLAKSRPTAVNLFWALEQMKITLAQQQINPLGGIFACAERIHAEDIAANHKMGELGADLLADARGVLTHCNTGALATGGYGTALGVIRSAYRRHPLKVYADETRPWLQGSRLTAWELNQERIPVTLIADSAAAWLMKSGEIDWIVVGADRITANGDVANKIGTYQIAVVAKYFKIPFYVICPPASKLKTGKEIKSIA